MKIELRRKAHSGYAATDADVRILATGEVEVKVRGGNTLRLRPSAQELLAAVLADAATQRAQQLVEEFRALSGDELRERLARMREHGVPLDNPIRVAAAAVMSERAYEALASVTECIHAPASVTE